MRGMGFGKVQLRWLVLVLLGASLLAGCLAETNNKAKTRKAISVSLARKIDEQLGPVDTSGWPLSHLGNNLQGRMDLEMLLTYLRLVEDTSLKQLSVGSPVGGLTNLQKGLLASKLVPASVDSNPCTEDEDNDGNADFTDLCLGRKNEISCQIIGPREFRVHFSDCRSPDPDLRFNLVHYTNTTATSFSDSTVVPTDQVSCTTISSNCFTGTTASPHQVSIVGTSTAYWNVNGNITYHNGVGGINEQTIEINYHRLHLELHDFLQAGFQNLLDLDNAVFELRGRRLVYRALEPTGAPALAIPKLPNDGMDIFDLDVQVDDDGALTNEAPGSYRLRLAMDWQDGMVFLHKSDAVLPPRPAFPAAPGAGTGVSYLFTFFDRDHLWNDGVGLGCQVQVENVDEATRTFDIMDPGLLTIPCPDIPAATGLEF